MQNMYPIPVVAPLMAEALSAAESTKKMTPERNQTRWRSTCSLTLLKSRNLRQMGDHTRKVP